MRSNPAAQAASPSRRRGLAVAAMVLTHPDRRTPWHPPLRLTGVLVHLRRFLPRPPLPA